MFDNDADEDDPKDGEGDTAHKGEEDGEEEDSNGDSAEEEDESEDDEEGEPSHGTVKKKPAESQWKIAHGLKPEQAAGSFRPPSKSAGSQKRPKAVCEGLGLCELCGLKEDAEDRQR